MGCSNIPVAVFTETNLGTRLAVPVSPDTSVDYFKREVEGLHMSCFPELGSIRVNAVMVKQKACHYHLSDSLPLKYAFMGLNGAWFLRVDVCPLGIPDHGKSSKWNDAKSHNVNSIANVVTDSIELEGFMNSSLKKRTKCRRKKVKMQRFQNLKAPVPKISAVFSFLKRKKKRKNLKKMRRIGCVEQGNKQHLLVEKETLCQVATRAEVNWSKKDRNVISEAPTDTFSEPASVSGIIKKYFSDYDEVASGLTTARSSHRGWVKSSNECQYSNIRSPQVSRDVWSEKPSSVATREKQSNPEVGKRLLLASDSLGLTPSNKQPLLSLCRYGDGKSPLLESSPAVQNLVFELTGKVAKS